MAKPDVPLRFIVDRPNVDEPLRFEITPKKDDRIGLLGIGVTPAASTTLHDDFEKVGITVIYESTGLAEAGISEGMTLQSANGETIRTYGEFDRIVNELDGLPVPTSWVILDETGNATAEPVTLELRSQPEMQAIQFIAADSVRSVEDGLFGLIPLTRINSVDAESPNIDILQAGDLILQIGDVHGPTLNVCQSIIQEHNGDTIDVVVQRDGKASGGHCHNRNRRSHWSALGLWT